MSKISKPTPNNQEFVLLSSEAYKKLANIDPTTNENYFWTTDADKELPIKLKLQKQNGREVLIPKTIPQLLLDNVLHHPEMASMHAEVEKGRWRSWTWED